MVLDDLYSDLKGGHHPKHFKSVWDDDVLSKLQQIKLFLIIMYAVD